VELRQFVALVSHKQKIPVSWSVVHSHRRVAVVNDFERAAFVFESYSGELSFSRISNVDGRLFLGDLAGSVVRIQVTPMLGPACPFVAPWCLPLGAWTRRDQNSRDRQQSKRYPTFAQIAPRCALNCDSPWSEAPSDPSPTVWQLLGINNSFTIKV
jgi:hypothetical protein